MICVLSLVLSAASCAPGLEPASSIPTYAQGAVAADHPLASQAGLEMLEQGGNAIDAAVATSFCLSVVRPYSCGIGGGGFMVIHLVDHEGRGPVTVALDYRERAPAAVGPEHFKTLAPHASRYSGHAVAIPGTVAGLLHALDTYGTLDRQAVLAPAIRVARAGYPLDHHGLLAAQTLVRFLKEQPTLTPGQAFLKQRFTNNGHPVVGALIRLPEQAVALEAIAQKGRAGFYDGPVAEAIVSAVAGAHGVLTIADLHTARVTTVQPLVAEAFGRRLVTMPLPSSGGIALIQMMHFLETHRPALMSDGRDERIHLIAEAMKHAFADRATWLGDPEFVDVPVTRLLDAGYLKSRAQRFDARATHPPAAYGRRTAALEGGGTSHLSVVDRHGNAVACTETINLEFGSRVVAMPFGFCLNNEMDDFLVRPGEPNAFGLEQSLLNLPAPGKRPLSSMTPTIVLEQDNRVFAVAGASGGPRIISATLQALLNTMVFDLDAPTAIGAPRIHHQWLPDVLFLESAMTEPRSGMPQLIPALHNRGHRLQTREEIGVVQLIRRTTGGWQAASDDRKGGVAAGH